MRNFVIFGDSLFAQRLCKIITIEECGRVIAFTQERSFLATNFLLDKPVLPFEDIENYIQENFEIVIGFGYSKMNNLREEIFNKCKCKGYSLATYISPKALVYSTDIGEGSFISAYTYIGPDCKIGVCNYIEVNTNISHNVVIGNFNFFSSNIAVGGFANIGNHCFIGLQSTIKDDISIADYSLIGQCANVLKNVEEKGNVYIGSPAFKLKDRKSLDSKI